MGHSSGHIDGVFSIKLRHAKHKRPIRAPTVDVLKRFAGYGIGIGTLKRGADGPVGLDGTVPEITSKPTAVVDTTAAGDSFNGAYLAAYIQGQNETQCMLSGHELASIVVSAPGAIVLQSRR